MTPKQDAIEYVKHIDAALEFCESKNGMPRLCGPFQTLETITQPQYQHVITPSEHPRLNQPNQPCGFPRSKGGGRQPRPPAAMLVALKREAESLGFRLPCAAANGVGDERRKHWPLALGLEEQRTNHRKRLGSRAPVVNVAEKVPRGIR